MFYKNIIKIKTIKFQNKIKFNNKWILKHLKKIEELTLDLIFLIKWILKKSKK